MPQPSTSLAEQITSATLPPLGGRRYDGGLRRASVPLRLQAMMLGFQLRVNRLMLESQAATIAALTACGRRR